MAYSPSIFDLDVQSMNVAAPDKHVKNCLNYANGVTMRSADCAIEVQKQRAENKEITGCTLLQCRSCYGKGSHSWRTLNGIW